MVVGEPVAATTPMFRGSEVPTVVVQTEANHRIGCFVGHEQSAARGSIPKWPGRMTSVETHSTGTAARRAMSLRLTGDRLGQVVVPSLAGLVAAGAEPAASSGYTAGARVAGVSESAAFQPSATSLTTPQPKETPMSELTPTAQVAPTGTLRAVINLGNPVLAQGTADEPRGVTVAIARDLARWLGVPLQLECVDAARKAYASIAEGRVDLCFLANEPAREEGVAFTAPYVVIEGVYVTDPAAPFQTSDDVDRDGVRIGVRDGSAYDLFLSRSLQHAEVVRADEAIDVYEEQRLEVAAGVRQPMAEYAASSGRRILEPPFMEINQAVGLPRDLDPDAVAAVAAYIEELKASGFIQDELARSGVDASAAPLV